MTRRFN